MTDYADLLAYRPTPCYNLQLYHIRSPFRPNPSSPAHPGLPGRVVEATRRHYLLKELVVKLPGGAPCMLVVVVGNPKAGSTAFSRQAPGKTGIAFKRLDKELTRA